MKLDNNLKERIDKYFAEISAEELYYILTDKYNLTNGDEILINKGKFQNINDTSLRC